MNFIQWLRELIDLLANPVVWKVLKWVLLYFAVAAAIGALPMPKPGGSELYRWFFFFANHFAANIKRALRALKVPGASTADPRWLSVNGSEGNK